MRVRFSSKSSVCNFCDKSLNHLFKKHILRQKKPDKKKKLFETKTANKKNFVLSSIFCQVYVCLISWVDCQQARLDIA